MNTWQSYRLDIGMFVNININLLLEMYYFIPLPYVKKIYIFFGALCLLRNTNTCGIVSSNVATVSKNYLV